MEEQNNQIEFVNEEGERIPLFVIEQTMISGVDYLLVTDSEKEDGDEVEAYIMKKLRDDEDQIYYEMVDDDNELSALSKVFAELLEDIDLEV